MGGHGDGEEERATMGEREGLGERVSESDSVSE